MVAATLRRPLQQQPPSTWRLPVPYEPPVFDPADEDGLLPVANVYPATRLWCNTEPAAWLLMDSDDFADYSTIIWDAWFPAERVPS